MFVCDLTAATREMADEPSVAAFAAAGDACAQGEEFEVEKIVGMIHLNVSTVFIYRVQHMYLFHRQASCIRAV